MARFYYGDDPLGRTVILGGGRLRTALTIVGVARACARGAWSDTDANGPYAARAGGRTDDHPARSTDSRAAAPHGGSRDDRRFARSRHRRDEARIEQEAVVSYVRTMDEQFDAALVRERVLATLSTGFGLVALLLAAVGLYGVMSQARAAAARSASACAWRCAIGSCGRCRANRVTCADAIGLAGALAAARPIATFPSASRRGRSRRRHRFFS